MNPTDLELAWAAGFLDGEGCFTLSKMPSATHESQRGMSITAVQTRVAPLLELQRLFGGNIRKMGNTKKGTEIFEWRCNGGAPVLSEVAQALVPYLRVKRREAEIVIAFAATVRRRGRPKAGVENFTSLEEIQVRRRLIYELAEIRDGALERAS